MNRYCLTLLALLLVLCGTSMAHARPLGGSGEELRGIPSGKPPELDQVGVKEHLDAQLPLDARFHDHTGRELALRDLWDGKRPMMLVFAYHSCPVLCSMILSATTAGLRGVNWNIGKEFDLVVVSIDPKETYDATARKRAAVITDYTRGGGRESAERGTHFLIGDKANIDRLTQAAGYEYTYEEDTHQYGHPSAVLLTKPTGEIARYLYGLEFSPNDLRLGLFEAGKGRSITTIEQIILYCYHYEPKGGKYVLMASRVMRLGGTITMLLLGSMLAVFWRRERKRGGLISAARLDAPAPAPVTATQVTS